MQRVSLDIGVAERWLVIHSCSTVRMECNLLTCAHGALCWFLCVAFTVAAFEPNSFFVAALVGRESSVTSATSSVEFCHPLLV